MPSPIVMPRLGLSMVEGTVTEWKVRPGDAVEAGQIILVIESEKAEVEIEAFAGGVVGALFVDVGTTVPIGGLLGAIVSEGESFDADAYVSSFVPEGEGAPSTAARESERPSPATPRPASPAGGAPKAAPAARALAKKLGVDLARVRGTGPGGRILPEDVERTAKGATSPAAGVLDHEVAGSGEPILFVCGYGVDRQGWRRQIDGLGGRFRVVTFDHRGVGDSPAASESVSIAELADDAAALIEHLGLERPTVVGASLGAAVAIELALRRPEALGRLVCLTPALRPDARFAAVLRSWSETERADDEARIGAMLPWLFGPELLGAPGKRAAAATALRTMATRTPPETLRGHAEALLAWLGSREGDLGAVRAPTLVVAGDEDRLTPFEQARAVARAIPGARLEVVVGAGHALMVEKPDAVNAAIASFATAA